MSHFIAVCLLPPGTKESQFESRIGKLIAPYDENKKSKKYLVTCGCVGGGAQEDINTRADLKFGTYDDLRAKLREATSGPEFKYPDLPTESTPKDEAKQMWAAYRKVEARVQKVWNKIRRPRERFEERETKKHPLRNKPDAECSECKGKGKHFTTYNKKSKWDWWVIGGRWPDYFNFGDYDPMKDPDNYETCHLCAGSGLRKDDLGMSERAKNPNYTCNGCSGKGKSLKFHLKQTHTHVEVAELLRRWKKPETRIVPFALVDPKGRWLEKGEMGWFACVSNEKKPTDWKKQVKAMYEKYPKHIAVAVDMHI